MIVVVAFIKRQTCVCRCRCACLSNLLYFIFRKALCMMNYVYLNGKLDTCLKQESYICYLVYVMLSSCCIHLQRLLHIGNDLYTFYNFCLVYVMSSSCCIHLQRLLHIGKDLYTFYMRIATVIRFCVVQCYLFFIFSYFLSVQGALSPRLVLRTNSKLQVYVLLAFVSTMTPSCH